MYVLDMKDIRKVIELDQTNLDIKLDDVKYRLWFSWQKTGYGQRCYFVCPACQKRFTKIYVINNKIRCRCCSGFKPYYAIQYTTKGGSDELEYRMAKYSFKHGIRFTMPFDHKEFVNDPRMKRSSFKRKIKILQALENMRFQNIFFNTTFSSKQINAVLTNKHPLLDKITTQELIDYGYRW